jgi:hypothetical protein
VKRSIADPKLVQRLTRSVADWNTWRHDQDFVPDSFPCCVEQCRPDSRRSVGSGSRGGALLRTNLTGSTLTEADRTGANLTGANLQHAQLAQADLTSTRLRKAVLTHANLQQAILEGAGLVGAVCQNTVFIGASGAGADLCNIDGRNADFSHAVLQDVDLRKADLGRAMLIATDFSAANLEETVLLEALSNADTKWPAEFDFREALGANEAARLDAERRQAPVVPIEEAASTLSLQALAEVEGLEKSEALWIAAYSWLIASSANAAGSTVACSESPFPSAASDRHSVIVCKSTSTTPPAVENSPGTSRSAGRLPGSSLRNPPAYLCTPDKA